MIGTNKDTEFEIENYEEFYTHEQFVPTSDEDAANINEVIPRFGWGFDKIEEYNCKSLLDLGTLDGSFPITIATHFDIPVVGVDLTTDGISLAKERAEKLGLKNTEFHQGTIEDYLRRFAKSGRKFDCITWFELIEHVKDVQECIRLIDACLNPGGIVMTSTPAFESPMYGMDDEKNKCHIRLYTMADDDYYAVNKYGTERMGTSIWKEIGRDRIKECSERNQLINVLYQ